MTLASDIAGLWAWYVADSGGWMDQSGNGRNATLPGGTNNPTIASDATNGHDAFNFVAASQQFVTLPSMAALTKGEAFLVVKVNHQPALSTATSGLWRIGPSATGQVGYPWTDGNVYETFGSSNASLTVTSPPNLLRFVVYNVRSDTNLLVSTFNGKERARVTVNTPGFLAAPTIGSSVAATSRYLDGQICEGAFFSAILAAADRSALIASLRKTYAPIIASQLIQAGIGGGTGGTGGGPGGIGDVGGGGAAWMYSV